jgi:uncharacterized membrane protein
VVGLAVGLEIFVAESPVAGDQAYVFPTTEVDPIVVPEGFKIQVFVKSAPASAVGIVLLTVTITWSVAVQPLTVLVAVSVYVVVVVGVATGFEMVVEDKPVEGDHV